MICKHSRSVGVMSLHRCTRKAVKDGYCTRHHPSYQSPSEMKALAEYERMESDPAYRARKWDEAAKAERDDALRSAGLDPNPVAWTEFAELASNRERPRIRLKRGGDFTVPLYRPLDERSA